METISFIIPNVNTKKYLEWCYNSIRKNLGYVHEIVHWNSNQSLDPTNNRVAIETNANDYYSVF